MEILSAVLAVFSSLGTWFVEFVPEMLAMFYVAETGLTFLGVLTVASLGIAIVLLVVNLIIDFMRFR